MKILLLLTLCLTARIAAAPPLPPMPGQFAAFVVMPWDNQPLQINLREGGPSFAILYQWPVRKLVLPHGDISYYCTVKVLAPLGSSYMVQVATATNGPWTDRTGFTARNSETNNVYVALRPYEVDRFFLRVRSQ